MTRCLLACLLLSPTAALAAEDIAPRIVVSGQASVSTPPDIALIHYSVVGEGMSSDEAVRAMVAKRKAIDQGLAALGAGEPKASDVSVIDVRGRDCFGGTVGNRPRLSVGECAIAGYIASLSLDIRTTRVAQAGTMVGLIGRLGGASPRLNGFALSDSDAPKRRALAAALADARRDAEALATGAGVRLGPLISVSDGSYAPIVVSGARIMAEAPPAPPPPPPIEVSLTPRPIETQARVTVTYQIQPQAERTPS